MTATKRRIGPVGTTLRALVGLGLLYIGVGIEALSSGIEAHDLLIGLVALPAIALALGLAARRYSVEPVRFDGPAGIVLNCAVIVALATNPYTGGGAALFYGATLLIAAWRGQPGCEATVIPNWVLGRDDQIGCPTFTPIDEAEAWLGRRRAQAPTARSHGA
jgi:hypothetical protein